MVERHLGKMEVGGSIPPLGSISCMTYDFYPLACLECGRHNSLARASEFPLEEGENLVDFCWGCMKHTRHRVVPRGCLVVWQDKKR